MMIIDAHGHADQYELFGWMDPPELVVDLMDKAGIDITCITTYGEAPAYDGAITNLAKYIQRFPDRLIGFVRIDPRGREKALAAIDEAAAVPGIMGVKLHPISNLIKPYSRFCLDVIRKAAARGMPVFFHCGDKVGAQPWQIGKAALACPEATIICHMGGFFHGEEAIRMAKACPNVYLDTSSVPYPEIVRKAVAELGCRRVVFATDNPAGDPISDLKKIRNLGFDRETEERIFYKNMASILGLTSIRGKDI